MSIKTRENLNAETEDQKRRRALAKETIDRIIRDTPSQISVEMYARSVAWEAYAAGWNNKADEVEEQTPAIIERFVEEVEKKVNIDGLDRRADDAGRIWRLLKKGSGEIK